MEMEGKALYSQYYNGQEKMIIKREDGFSLVELMITMVVFVLFMIAATNVFTGLLTQFKQQSKQAETNIEGIVGLEIMRQDIEGAGYGLPWNGIVAYDEAEDNPHTLNDSPTGIPKGIVSQNSATFFSPNNIFDGSDYLAIKSMTVARNSASAKWTTLNSNGDRRIWTTAGESTPVSENLQDTDRVIVLTPGGTTTSQRTLIVNSNAFFTTYGGVTSLPWKPVDPAETRLVYGVDPADHDLRMPFNRADYFITLTDGSGKNIVPKRCAPGTGVLVKATVNHIDGYFTYLPLLECVADLQVIYGLDSNADGSFDPFNSVGGIYDSYSDDLTALSAQTIREQVKQVRVYILAHEGQKDTNYIFSNFTVGACSTCIKVGEFGLGNDFDLLAAIGDPDYKYYRWKVYTIVVTPNNLE